jgi:Na+/H+-dicarboxylate symporter
VLVAMACGVAVGVATGIGQSRDMKRMGRVGVRALL